MIKSKLTVCAISAFVLATQYANAEHISMEALLQDSKIYVASTNNSTLPLYNVLEDVDSGIIVHTETNMYTTTDVHIRKKKTRNSKSIKIINGGKKLTITDYDHDHKWQEVEYKNIVGYIKTEYLSKTQPLYTRVRSVKLHGLSEVQKQRAYTIAEISIKEWDKYGVLPSVAIAQAMQESTLGKHCSGNNLWGIASGAISYSSLENGVYGYLHVINNGCYGTAPFAKNASSQISKILAGGYCTPVGDYYNDVMWIINHYGLERFDQMI